MASSAHLGDAGDPGTLGREIVHSTSVGSVAGDSQDLTPYSERTHRDVSTLSSPMGPSIMVESQESNPMLTDGPPIFSRSVDPHN